jgi:hypothetical protein
MRVFVVTVDDDMVSFKLPILTLVENLEACALTHCVPVV